jgi:hypothetical protein
MISFEEFGSLTGIIVTRKTADCGVVRLGDDHPRTLGAKARAVGVVIHERNLLGRLVCDIEVVLKEYDSITVSVAWSSVFT